MIKVINKNTEAKKKQIDMSAKLPVSESITSEIMGASKEESKKIIDRAHEAAALRDNEEKEARKQVEEMEKADKEMKVQQVLAGNRIAADLAKSKDKPTGEQHKPLPWIPPYPEAEFGEDGKDTVFVRATVLQDIYINGDAKKIGQHTLPASFAHSNSHAIAAPKDI